MSQAPFVIYFPHYIKQNYTSPNYVLFSKEYIFSLSRSHKKYIYGQVLNWTSIFSLDKFIAI